MRKGMRGEEKKPQDNLGLCEAGEEKNGGHREKCLVEVSRDKRLEDLGKSWVKRE